MILSYNNSNYLKRMDSKKIISVDQYQKEEDRQDHQEADENLKKKISDHPLYGLLVETHMDCLKVSCIGDVDQNKSKEQNASSRKNSLSSSFPQPDLDHFMEAYCRALSKLKEAMEEPQQETVAFINSMHLQLSELTSTFHDAAATQPSAGERNE